MSVSIQKAHLLTILLRCTAILLSHMNFIPMEGQYVLPEKAVSSKGPVKGCNELAAV